MLITLKGAAREVTGSCYLVETSRTRLLVDCGMFQGSHVCQSRNFEAFDFDPKTIDAVILTHAHLDHTGRLPKLVKAGFRGKVYCTPPTVELTKLVLEDACQIMREDFKREYRPPLYEEADVTKAMSLFVPLDYNHHISLGDLRFRLREAGHIFGSSFVELEERGGARVTFSGDVGNEHVPILRPTAQLAETDVLFVESTYGNRVHEDESTREVKLKAVIEQTVKQRGVLIIPAFAIERTQQLLYEMNHLVENKLVPRVAVYLDSPMALAATEVIDSYPQYYDREALRLVAAGDDLFAFDGLHLTRTRDESKTINDAARPKIIISGSGMMNGGRILHHLVRYLGDPKTTLLIIGYQAEKTLGRQLYRGDKTVRVMGEMVQVKARVMSIGAYSAHADQHMLLRWVGSAAKPPTHVYCTHGEEGAAVALATEFQTQQGLIAEAPRLGQVIKI